MSNTLFLLVISGTDTIKHQGISAAGANYEMLPYTAALDAEFIYHGHTKILNKLPVSPNGIVSPALISKACLKLLDMDYLIIDTGAHIKPQCPYNSFRENPGADIASGQAMTYPEALELYQSGKAFYESIKKYSQVIIAECIVGGTTTALGLLEALRYKCSGMLSSSLPDGNHDLKTKIIEAGLKQANITNDPLTAVAAMGDPMQAFVAGLAQSCSENNLPVTLAGGTQMIAVYALIRKLTAESSALNGINITTTPWIVNDKSAKFQDLCQLFPDLTVQYTDSKVIADIPLLDQQIQLLSDSKLTLNLILDRYNEGHVKEGVGMGALIYQVLHSSSNIFLLNQ